MAVVGKSFMLSKEEATKMVMSTYSCESCGICQESEVDTFWFNPISRSAHGKCIKLIEKAEESIKAMIEKMYPTDKSNLNSNLAHVAIVDAVQKAIGKESIAEFVANKSIEALKELFDSVGVKALYDYEPLTE